MYIALSVSIFNKQALLGQLNSYNDAMNLCSVDNTAAFPFRWTLPKGICYLRKSFYETAAQDFHRRVSTAYPFPLAEDLKNRLPKRTLNHSTVEIPSAV